MSGLELLLTDTVALPIHSWAVDLTVEEDRPLPRLEETILRLAQAGVREFHRFTQLLGVEERHLARAFGDLRLKSALSAQGGTYEVTAEGLKLLDRAAHRTLRKTSVRLWHDPYTNTLSWADFDNDEVLNGTEQRESGLRSLPAPVELREDELRERHREIQALIRENGLPDDPDDLQDVPVRHLVSVASKGHSTVFLPVELAVHRHIGTGQLVYLLKRNGRPDRETSLALKELAERNIDLMPFELLRTLPPKIQGLMDRLITLQGKGEAIENDDFRIDQLLQRATTNAQRVVTLFSPFQPSSRLGTDSLRKIRTRLLQAPELRAQVVVTGSMEESKSLTAARQFLSQMQKMEAIGSRIEVFEASGLQTEGAIVDSDWALIDLRQYALHPWKTEYGLPYSRVKFIPNRAEVEAFRMGLRSIMDV